MKKEYEIPEIDIIEFKAKDMITESLPTETSQPIEVPWPFQ